MGAVDESNVWAKCLRDRISTVLILCLGWQMPSGHLRKLYVGTYKTIFRLGMKKPSGHRPVFVKCLEDDV